ncbi:MAG: hypothetical protein KAQ90_11060 [Melioribacteraceae bacterium]|nr:hypothetical protein [Melioribacteraceae bacterium]
MNQQLLLEVESYVKSLFNDNSSEDLIYHNIIHTTDVVITSEKIGQSSSLDDEQMELLLIAAWFHDVGYLEAYEEHEEKSVLVARNFLAEHDYPKNKIDEISSAILTTKVPQSPQNIIHDVLCDADLHHLGSKNFSNTNELFRVEYENINKKMWHELDWLKDTIEFMRNHTFHTKYSKERYDEIKKENLLKLQKRYRKQLSKVEAEEIKREKLNLEKEKLIAKKESSKKADRGIETMFRNVMRTHVFFSSLADNKANIMITVNTLILGAIVTVLARKLDANPHLVIPTLVLTVVSLTTLIFAILVTRPKITPGTFTKEDIHEKRANLLFFGNFFNMDFDDFSWGMEEMMNDKKYLYNSMIKDFYLLGQVLGQKYKYLRICYNIFMYGFIISIIVFAIYIYLYPEGATQIGDVFE